MRRNHSKQCKTQRLMQRSGQETGVISWHGGAILLEERGKILSQSGRTSANKTDNCAEALEPSSSLLELGQNFMLVPDLDHGQSNSILLSG